MKAYKTTSRAKRTKNTIGAHVRVWMQFPFATVTVALGHPTTEGKFAIPEAWEVGHLPVHFGWGLNHSLVLTDFTEEELNQLVVAFNLAINAARPVCRLLDERAYDILQSGAELDEVPRRILRGAAPQLIREINTILTTDPYDEEFEPGE